MGIVNYQYYNLNFSNKHFIYLSRIFRSALKAVIKEFERVIVVTIANDLFQMAQGY